MNETPMPSIHDLAETSTRLFNQLETLILIGEDADSDYVFQRETAAHFFSVIQDIVVKLRSSHEQLISSLHPLPADGDF